MHSIVSLSSLKNRISQFSSVEEAKLDFESNPECWDYVFKDQLSWLEISFEEQEERKDAIYLFFASDKSNVN